MPDPSERAVSVNGRDCRVWEKGSGPPVGYLAGLLGLSRWTPFLDRLAERRRVVVPSLPGFPGATGHDLLDGTIDWVAATLDLLEGAGLEGADLVGASVGATLSAEAAAMSQGAVSRLVLIAPFGLFDEREPVTDFWAQMPGTAHDLLCARSEAIAEQVAMPGGADPVEWPIVQTRASEAAARLLWPTTDTGLRRRLHRIRVPTLLLWGAEDRIVPASYAKVFAAEIAGETTLLSIPGAGHLADLDAPDAVAEAVLGFLG
jgi:pimeloyl-ACP methyl ester carboxylesterase